MASLQLCLIMVISMVVMVHSRILRLNTSQHLIPDSVDRFEKQYQIIHLNGSSLSSHSCPSIYGFFPCAYNTGGFIFQIVTYEYLLYLGEKLVTIGSDRLLQIFGTGIYGASFFQILKVLPGLTTLIVSGVITSKAKAQEQVSQGVSVYAGSTILSLTLVWLMSVIFGRHEIKTSTAESSASKCVLSSPSKCVLWKAKLCGFMELGITTDKWTRYTAGIMLLTLIPFAIVELVNIFSTSLARRVVILVALIVSSASLFSYFAYQIWKPWMQKRSLEYIDEKLLAGFLHHCQQHVKGKLINEDGQLNIPEIERLFQQLDKDGDQSLTRDELENSTLGSFGFGKLDKKDAMSKISEAFDVNNDRKIHLREFIEGFMKCEDAAKKLAEKDGGTTKDILSEVVQPVMNKEGKEGATIEHLMSRILKHVQSQAHEAEQLINDDGSPNTERIESLFKQYDADNDGVITQSELEQLIRTSLGESHLNHDGILIKDFDKDGNREIDMKEFVERMTKWITEAIAVTKRKDAKSIDEYHKIIWGGVEKKHGLINKLLTRAFNKSIFEVLLGIVMLTFLVKPLTISIRQFSDAMGLSSLIVSFVIVPVALNARRLAIFSSHPMNERIASLTFSEIYGGVIMNNLTGLVTVLAIIYAKDLKWEYSAEVLIMFVVCAIVGFFAFFRTNYPIWTCIIAFLLYPLSLVLFYFVHHLLGRRN